MNENDAIFILARALAAWGNPPPVSTTEERVAAILVYERMLYELCTTWNLVITTQEDWETRL